MSGYKCKYCDCNEVEWQNGRETSDGKVLCGRCRHSCCVHIKEWVVTNNGPLHGQTAKEKVCIDWSSAPPFC